MQISSVQLNKLLQDFGHDAFRPGQEECIRALLAGRDVLGVLPTSAGKSLVYQLTAQLLPGITVVVSPLIALMQDQVESLEDHGIEAGALNSMRSPRERTEDIGELEAGESKLVYVTPERLSDQSTVSLLARLNVSLFVVDEAHCITEWGHDFRPAFLALIDAVAALGRPTILALTATATPVVMAEITERLGLRDPHIEVHGTDRPNLFFEVRRVESTEQKWRQLEQLFEAEVSDGQVHIPSEVTECMSGSGIVYTATTRSAQMVAEWLMQRGISADYYHGRRRASERERVQEAFMSDDVRVIAATNAFGLGVDKPDVRFVLHLDPPPSVEAYYQEAGRGGRDGQPARCILLTRDADLSRTRFLSATGQTTVDDLERVRAALKLGQPQSREKLRTATGLSRSVLQRAIDVLGDAQLVRLHRGRVHLTVDDFAPADVSVRREDERRSYERSRVEMLRTYVELRECRRRFLVNYFGEKYPREHCGYCDNDADQSMVSEVPMHSIVQSTLR